MNMLFILHTLITSPPIDSDQSTYVDTMFSSLYDDKI